MGFLVVGIDVGYSRPGLSAVHFDKFFDTQSSTLVFSGYLETKADKGDGYKSVDDARRVEEIVTWIDAKIRQFHPDLVTVELPLSGAKSAGAIKCMALAAGATIGALKIIQRDIPFKQVVYSPYETKRACTGDPVADKEAMILAAMNAWPSVEWPMLKPTKKRKDKIHAERAEAMADSMCAILAFVRLNFGKSTSQFR